MVSVRPGLEEFAIAMEEILQKHDRIKGNSWLDPSFTIYDCLWRVEEEIEEFRGTQKSDELLDAANFIFFAWYKRRLK